MRFLLLAYPLLVLLIAAFGFLTDQLGFLPGGLWPGRTPVTGPAVAAAWGLEALAFLALFLLLEGRFRSRTVAGLATAWIAWVFRGPLLVISVAAAGFPREPWWRLSIAWWGLYTFAGLALARLAMRRPPAADDLALVDVTATPAPRPERVESELAPTAPAAPEPVASEPAVREATAPETASPEADEPAGRPES